MTKEPEEKLVYTRDHISSMELTQDDIDKIKACPYFDKEIFKELTGISIK